MISPGLRIGRYEIGKRLGKGGFGVVHVARDLDLDREVAIKVLKPEYLAKPQIVQRFIKEARAAAKIGHAGIVTVFECGQIQSTGTRADGNAYIAMELLVGESLSDRLLNGGRMAVPQAIAIARQLAAALGAAHAAGIVHRDLKPDNVFLVPDPAVHGGERVKVLDFGVAKLFEPSSDGVDTHSHMMLGTPKYMSPEQARSAAKVDHRSDIYMLGCIVYEMVTGQGPFSGDAGEQLLAHQKTPPPSARARVPTVPASLDALIARMLAKSQDDRPQTMTHVIDALAETTDEPDTQVRAPITTRRTSAEITTVQEQSPVERLLEQRRLLSIAAGLGLVISAVVVYMVMRRSDDTPRPAPAKPVDVPIAEVSIDAAAVAVVPDAEVVVDIDRAQLTIDCKDAIDKQRWSDAMMCAEKLRTIAKAEGDQYFAQAKAEELAEVSNRALETALSDGDWKRARTALDAIGQDSVYRHDAELHVTAAEHRATAQLVETLTMAKISNPKDCKTYDTLLRQAGGVLPTQVIDDAKRRISCTSAATTAPPPPQQPTSSKKCNADALTAEGMEAFSAGQNLTAFAKFEASYKCRPDTNTLKMVFVCACKAKRADKAKPYWKKMSKGMQNDTLQFCIGNGIAQDYLNAP